MKHSLSVCIGLLGLAGIAGTAQAQTVTTVFDQNITVDPLAIGSINFAVSAPGSSLYIEGLAVTNPAIEGVGTLTEDGHPSFSQSFILAPSPGIVGDYFNTANLGAGLYTLAYEFVDQTLSAPFVVNIEGTLTSAAAAPELDAGSAASALTLLAGAVLVLLGRRRTVAARGFA